MKPDMIADRRIKAIPAGSGLAGKARDAMRFAIHEGDNARFEQNDFPTTPRHTALWNLARRLMYGGHGV
jgi:hypothetical protein